MVFAAVLVQALLATAAFASPAERRANRIARRASGIHQSRPLQVSDGALGSLANNASHVSYSSNWSGAVLNSAAGTYKSVTASFVVPTPKEPSGGTGTHSASAWVGIDGDTCGTAILQTGVDFTVSGSTVSYDAWYEWYPDYAYDFSGIPISAGNTITVTVTASSTKAGSATITNVSTGKTVTKALTSTAALCEKDAEWIVEDFEENGSLVPLANFGTVTFTNAKATTGSGTVGPSGAVIIDMEQGSTVYTSVSTGTNTVTVTYV